MPVEDLPGGLLGGIGKLARKQPDRVYVEAARLLGIAPPPDFWFFQPSKLTGMVGSRQIVIREMLEDNSKGISYVVSYPPLGLNLRIYTRSRIAKFVDSLGGNHAFGDPDFEERFRVETSNPVAVQALLGPELQAHLAKLQDRYPSLEVGETQVGFVSKERRVPGQQLASTIRDLVDLSWMLVGEVPASSVIPSGPVDSPPPPPKADALEAPLPQPVAPPRIVRPPTAAARPADPSPPAAAPRPPGPPPAAATSRPTEVPRPTPVVPDPRVADEAVGEAPPPPPPAVMPPLPEPIVVEEPTRTPMSKPAPESPSVPGSSLAGDQIAQLSKIFAEGPLRSRASFDRSFAGRSVEWTGTVRSSVDFTSDVHFGRVAGNRVTIAVGEIDVAGFGELMIEAVVHLPEGTEVTVGDDVTFRGTLLKLDGLTRDIYVENGSL